MQRGMTDGSVGARAGHSALCALPPPRLAARRRLGPTRCYWHTIHLVVLINMFLP